MKIYKTGFDNTSFKTLKEARAYSYRMGMKRMKDYPGNFAGWHVTSYWPYDVEGYVGFSVTADGIKVLWNKGRERWKLNKDGSLGRRV